MARIYFGDARPHLENRARAWVVPGCAAYQYGCGCASVITAIVKSARRLLAIVPSPAAHSSDRRLSLARWSNLRKGRWLISISEERRWVRSTYGSLIFL